MSNAPKRLYRSNTNRILGGVCGGIAEYFNIDPVIVRLIWIVITVFYGLGILIYLIAWVIIPQSPEGNSPAPQGGSTSALSLNRRGREALAIFGSILVLIGSLALSGVTRPLRFIVAHSSLFQWLLYGLGRS